MLFKRDITVSANTAIADADENKIKVSDGIIHRIAIIFPSGCSALVGVQLLEGSHPIAPTTEGFWFKGDDRVIDYPDFYEITTGARYITVKTYNLDTKYDHEIIVEVYILKKNVVAPMLALDRMIKSIVNVFARNEEEKLE
ncbi:MAG: hypothetical protein ACTSQY_03275 [Candidatus Odinarchaeia archaeon]